MKLESHLPKQTFWLYLGPVLNVLPFPPLDGSGAVPIVLSDNAARKYLTFMWSNRAFGLLGLVIAWQLFKYVFDPVFFGAVNLLYPGMRYG